MSHLGAYIENPKNTTFESQENGEVLYFLLRRHPITNLGWILFVFVMIIAPLIGIKFIEAYVAEPFEIVPAKYQLVLLIVWYLLTMFYAFTGVLTWYFNVYIITNRRIIDVDFRGLWRKRVSEALLGSVEDVTYQTHHFWQILFNYGDIFMQTAAEKAEFEFQAIPNPNLVHDKLTDIVQDYKSKHRHGNSD